MRLVISKEQRIRELEYLSYKNIVRKMRRGKVEKINFKETNNSITKRRNGTNN